MYLTAITLTLTRAENEVSRQALEYLEPFLTTQPDNRRVKRMMLSIRQELEPRLDKGKRKAQQKLKLKVHEAEVLVYALRNCSPQEDLFQTSLSRFASTVRVLLTKLEPKIV